MSLQTGRELPNIILSHLIKVQGQVWLIGFEKPVVPHWHFNSEHTKPLWGKGEVCPWLGVLSPLLYSSHCTLIWFLSFLKLMVPQVRNSPSFLHGLTTGTSSQGKIDLLKLGKKKNAHSCPELNTWSRASLFRTFTRKNRCAIGLKSPTGASV